MNKTIVNCPHCDKRISASDRLAGKKVACPHCKQPFQVTFANEAPAKDREEVVPPKPTPSVPSPAPAPPNNYGLELGGTNAFEETMRPPPLPVYSNMISCPDCGKQISRRATSCPSCGAPMRQEVAAPLLSVVPVDQLPHALPPTVEQPLTVRSGGSGKLYCTGPYDRIFAATKHALQLCQVNLKKVSESTGEIQGNAPYGINMFGMSIYVSLRSLGLETRIEISASFTDAFDTFGACTKKVNQISEQLIETIGTASRPVQGTEFSPAVSVAPRLSSQAGPSLRGRAMTGFFLSLLGLCFGPVALVGLILSSITYSSIASSKNQEGSGWAIAGIVLGFLGLLLWAFAIFIVVGVY